MDEEQPSVEHFLELIRKSKRGRFKIYIGMSAGVGKTYRMLQEAQALLRNGVNVQIGYIETHGRVDTEAQLTGLPVLPRRKLFYKGKELDELDVPAILAIHPEVVIVDELAHTNIEGSKNEKRWQDVMDILEAGISVISAVNIQHLESLNEEVERITGVKITERIPDRILQVADEVVNIDLTADELVTRLREGRIYTADKIPIALGNFFQSEKILQLRELALKEVASQVERKIETEVVRPNNQRSERFLACISSNADIAKRIIRKTPRLAAHYNARWFVLYVQTPAEAADRIPLAIQRHLLNNFKLATELGGEVIQVKSDSISQGILDTAESRRATTLCLGKPHLKLWQVILSTGVFNQLLKKMSASDVDIIILS